MRIQSCGIFPKTSGLICINSFFQEKRMEFRFLQFYVSTNQAPQSTLKASPSPVCNQSSASRITTGIFSDNMKGIAVCDCVSVVRKFLMREKLRQDLVMKHSCEK